MPTNYGSIDRSKPRKKRAQNLINHDSIGATPAVPTEEEIKHFSRNRLIELAKQNRAPSVAKAAAAELLERVEPKKERPEPAMTAAEAVRIGDIYQRIFADAPCPNCGYRNVH